MFISKIIFNFENLKSDNYLKKLSYYKVNEIKFNKKIIFITGENGIGKTTLLEVLAYNFNLNKFGGSKNFILDESNEPEINQFVKLVKELDKPKDSFFFRSDTFFNLEKDLIKYNCPSYNYSGEKSFKEQSRGESFMSFFRNRIGNNGLYFFDEPETALSFDNQILFLFLLKQFERDANQIFIYFDCKKFSNFQKC
ncbi:hypothetical protein EOM09_04380 [bacterium]|nr:hypothetical protein [bacterium]